MEREVIETVSEHRGWVVVMPVTGSSPTGQIDVHHAGRLVASVAQLCISETFDDFVAIVFVDGNPQVPQILTGNRQAVAEQGTPQSSLIQPHNW